MKKFSVLFSIIMIAISFIGCVNANEKKLKEIIEEADKDCPINMGILGDVISVKYDDEKKEAQFYYLIKDDILDIEVLKNNEEMARQSAKLSFSGDSSRELLEEMIKAGAGLSLIYKSGTTGDDYRIKLSVDDLKEALNNPLTEHQKNKLLLDNHLLMENARCPYNVENGMEMVEVIDKGENIVYNYRLDEGIYQIGAIEELKMNIKKEMGESFDDPFTKKFIKILISLGKGIAYHYYGATSGESVDIYFSPDELESCIEK